MATKVGSFSIGTGAATTTVAVTGVGFQPTLVLFWWSGRTDTTDANGSASINAGFGFMGGATDRGCQGASGVDANAGGDFFSRPYVDSCIVEMNAAGAAISGAADFSSFDSDGFTVVIDDQFAADMRICYLATDEPTNVSVGSVTVAGGSPSNPYSITDPGFAPTGIITLTGWTSATGGTTALKLNIGAYDGTNQWGVAVSGSEGSPVDTERYGLAGEVGIRANAAADRVDMNALTATGFDYDKTGSNGMGFIYCAFDGTFAVGDFVTATDTSNFSETGVGQQPQGIVVVSACKAASTPGTMDDHALMSIGGATSASERVAVALHAEDALTTTEEWTAIDFDSLYVRSDQADGVAGVMDLVSMDSDGFTLVMDDADPDAAFVGYMAFGAAAASGGSGIAVRNHIMRMFQ